MPFSLADLPKELLEEIYPHVDIPFALRITCLALRDAFTNPLIEQFDKRIRGVPLDRRDRPHKTKTALDDVVQDVRLIAWACENGCYWNNLLAYRAAACGREEALNYLCEFQGLVMDFSHSMIAATHGRLVTLSWMYAKGAGTVWNELTCNGAAKNGHLHCLEFAFTRGCPFSNTGLNAAARNGHYVCVEFMLMQNARKSHWRRSDCTACDYAAEGGHIRVLALLREFQIPFTRDTADACAKGGNLDCFEYLIEQGCPHDYEWCFQEAACSGHANIVVYIASKWAPGHPYFHEELVEDLASYGNRTMPVLKLAREWGANFNNEMLVPYAAQGGHLECMKWLMEQGAPLNESTTNLAATGGHLDVLNWVADQPNMCWDDDTYDGAIQSKHLHVLEWAYNTRKVGGPWQGSVLAEKVARTGDFEMAKWVINNGFVWGKIATRINVKLSQKLVGYLEKHTSSV